MLLVKLRVISPPDFTLFSRRLGLHYTVAMSLLCLTWITSQAHGLITCVYVYIIIVTVLYYLHCIVSMHVCRVSSINKLSVTYNRLKHGHCCMDWSCFTDSFARWQQLFTAMHYHCDTFSSKSPNDPRAFDPQPLPPPHTYPFQNPKHATGL